MIEAALPPVVKLRAAWKYYIDTARNSDGHTRACSVQSPMYCSCGWSAVERAIRDVIRQGEKIND